jgi:hypothetical protein
MKRSFIAPKYVPYLLIIIGPAILMAYPILTGQSLFWGTPALQFVPWRVNAFDQILQGRLPFLNEYNGFSAPLPTGFVLSIYLGIILLLFNWRCALVGLVK